MADDDAIVIDIEVSTGSIKELQDILKQVKEAETSLQRIKSEGVIETLRARKSKLPLGGGAPTDVSRVIPERTGALGGQIEGEALPLKGRDRTSAQAVQTENRFKELEGKVDLIDKFISIGGTGLSLAGSVSRGGIVGFFEKLLKHPLGKGLIAVSLVKILAEQIADELQSPGAPFDIRFRRNIKEEVAATLSRKEKAELRQGFRTLVVTTRPGLRGGQGQIRSNVSDLADRNPQYDYFVDVYAKGLNLP